MPFHTETPKSKTDYFSYTVAALFCLSVTLGFLIPKVQGICFFILAITGMVSMARSAFREKIAVTEFWREYRWLCFSMMALVIAVFISELVNRNFHIQDYDAISRFLFFPFILWCFVKMKGKFVSNLPLSFIAICIPGFILAFIATNGGEIRSRQYLPMTSFIIFSCLTTIMACILVLFLIENFKKQNRYINLLIGIAIICGLYISFLYKVRNVWLGYPLFAILCFYGYRKTRQNQNNRKAITLIALVIILLGILSYSTNIYKTSRLQEGINDIQQLSSNPDTSIGIRLQHWHGSLIAFNSSPVFGITLSRMPDFFRDLYKKGVVSRTASINTQHPHNEILFTMATRGTVGLLALLVTWFIPAIWFVKKIQKQGETQSVFPSLMGLCLIGGYFFFTLVDCLFFWQRAVMFYVVMMAFLVSYEKHLNEEK
ncbi:MAG: O-antigen ligase family protein [Alistipes senegalensis]|nr:O-antigen ligase family protein [Oxalobacter formigenes]MCM1281095.1 O-antigen ligase family protein [Alistipes senegalensis]